MTKIDLDFLVPIVGESCRGEVRDKPVSFDDWYPRRYVESASHFSPKAQALLASLANDISHELRPDQRQELWEMVNMGRLAKWRVPTWWVGADLFVALTQTAPPLSIRWEEILWPTPAIQFMLPIKESRQIFQRNVSALSGSTGQACEVVKLPRNKFGQRHEICLAPAQPATLSSVVIAATCYYLDGRSDGTLSMHTPVTPGLTVGDVMTGKWPHGFDIGDGATYDAGDKERMDLAVAVFVQLLLLLSMRSDVMQTGGDLIMGAQTSGKGADKVIIKPSLFHPRWVGEHFKREPKPAQGGTHASPEMHLRAGHWRDQPVGKGRTGIKPIWIKPMWINAPKEVASA